MVVVEAVGALIGGELLLRLYLVRLLEPGLFAAGERENPGRLNGRVVHQQDTHRPSFRDDAQVAAVATGTAAVLIDRFALQFENTDRQSDVAALRLRAQHECDRLREW